MPDPVEPDSPATPRVGKVLLLIFSWLWVGVPLAWGILETLRTSLALWR